MTQFQAIALALVALYLVLVALFFRRNTAFLVGGLAAAGALALGFYLTGRMAPADVGLAAPGSWPMTVAWAAGWTALMLAYSPLADRIASAVFKAPPTLQAFGALQKSLLHLLAGIAIAWLLGGVLEELVFRGIVVTALDAWLAPLIGALPAAALAILAAALGAGLCHYYQGPRAMVIITQLSVLFGVLYVLSGYNLYAVILAHGFYDTIAFIRFARRESKYAKLDAAA